MFSFTLQVWFLRVDLLLLVLLAGVLLARRERRPGNRDLLGLCAVWIAALALRLLLSPHTLMHENAHGYEYLRSAFQMEGFFYHGAAYPTHFHLLGALFGRTPETVFVANACLGAASAVLLVPLVRRLTDSREAGWFAGVAYACWPLALRLGASESMFPLAVFSGLFAWYAWFRAWDSGRPVWFFATALSLAFAVQVRPVMALWPGVLLLSLAVCPGWTRRLRIRWVWLSALTCFALTLPWLVFRVTMLAQEGLHTAVRLAPADVLAGFVSADNLLLRLDWIPALAWMFAAAGLAVLAARRPRALLPLLAGFLLLAWMVMGVRTGESSAVRLQQPLQVFVVALAACGASRVADLAGYRGRHGLLVLMGIMLVTSSLARAPRIRAAYNPQREYTFLREQVPELPRDCAVVTADRFMANRVVSTEFPAWWMGERPVVEQSEFLARPGVLAEWPCVLYYRGLSCYCFTHADRRLPPDGIRPACHRVGERYRLDPLVEETFDNRPFTSFRVPAGRITVGFYRVR